MQDYRLVFTEDGIVRTAKQFLAIVNNTRHIAFYGDMGVGKTTFISAICQILGTKDLVSSPTFAIINEYELNSGIPAYHFDFYRIKSSVELMDIGYYEYLKDDAYCFVEWPERSEDLIDDSFLKIKMTENPDGKRELLFSF